MFVFCLFVYFLSGYLQVGIDKGERSVTVCFFLFVRLLPLWLPPGGYKQRIRECDSMCVFCLFVYFLSVYLQVGIDKGEGSVTVCLFSVCLSTSSLATSRWV